MCHHGRTLPWAVSLNNLLGYETRTQHMFLKPNNKNPSKEVYPGTDVPLLGTEILSHLCGRQRWGLLLLLNSQQSLPLYLTHYRACTVFALVFDSSTKGHTGCYNITLSKKDEWREWEGAHCWYPWNTQCPHFAKASTPSCFLKKI